MNTRRCFKIAGRINALLVSEIGQGIDPARMLAEPLYARDVLLVCQALPGSELAELAPQFIQAALALAADNEARAEQRSGFQPSRFLASLFSPSTGSPAQTLDNILQAPAKKPRRWFGRLGK